MGKTIINDVTYSTGRLPAKVQFHVVRRLGKVLGKLSGMAGLIKAGTTPEELQADPEFGMAMLEPLAEGLAEMSDEAADYVIDHCLAVVERKQASGGMASVMVAGKLMFEDMDMGVMIQLVWAVLQENLSGFFGGQLPGSGSPRPT